ncbi:MAG: phospholipid carrier-dependent glycosyltransferase [Anaerolineales bacterium]|nr:phospholipid carrier-dependent glycosyltransferase [Anaerolineales bacterium]
MNQANPRQYGLLILIMGVYISLTWLNSASIPLSKAPDEYVHFLYGRFIAEHHRLPTTAQERQQAGYKSDQPPLYYGLLALSIGWVDTSNPPHLKMTWDSPQRKLVDLVLPRAMIVRTEDETWPYAGVVLAWMSGRWLSIFLGVLTIILVYGIALEIFPGNFALATGAAGVVAFMPRFTFISAVLSDETLLGVIISFYFWLLVKLVKGQTGFWHVALIGLAMGLALITKYSAVVLPLEFLLLLLILIWTKKLKWPVGLRKGAIACGLLALTSAGWFVFQSWYFNQIDELGWVSGIIRPLIAGDETEADSTTFIIASSLTGTSETAETTEETEGSIWDWSYKFFTEFWQVEVYGKPPLYPPFYNLLLMGGVCGAAGLALIWDRSGNQGQSRLWLTVLVWHFFVFIPIPLMRYILTGRIHDTAQARYLMFSAAPAIGILLAWGTAKLTGPKYQRYGLVGLVVLMVA